jgi:hypothetical protein
MSGCLQSDLSVHLPYLPEHLFTMQQEDAGYQLFYSSEYQQVRSLLQTRLHACWLADNVEHH